MMEDDELIAVHDSFFELSSNLILSGVDPLLIAGVMTSGGMQLYKRVLPEEDFKRMQKTIGTTKLK